MLGIRMIVPQYLVSELWGMIIFLQTIVVRPITCNMNVYQVMIMCHLSLWLLPVSELLPFDCVLCLFSIVYTLVHAITNLEFSQNDVLGSF